MIDEQMNDEYGEKINQVIKNHAKRKTRKKIFAWLAGIALPSVPTLIIILLVVFIVLGILPAYLSRLGLIKGLTGRSDVETIKEYSSAIEGLTDEEILELIKSGGISDSFFDAMMMNREEFQYLMEKVIEYNSDEASQTIEIECKHTYLEWVDTTPPAPVPDPTDPGNPLTPVEPVEPPEPQGYYEQKTEYEYRNITVNSRDIEKFHLDWELVYALCLTSSMNDFESWFRIGETAEDEGKLYHQGEEMENIDYVISHLAMEYEYVTDLARSSKTRYSLDECKSLVHTTYQYGDPDTEEGEWLYYYPHSVLERAYSGYSCMYYLMDAGSSKITNQITAADVNHFELIVKRFCPNYNFGYLSLIMQMIPGGEAIANKLQVYYDHKDEGYEINNKPLNYELGSGIDSSLLPVSTERLETEFGDLTDYGDLIYDPSIGGDIVREAMTKVGMKYSQANRWDADSYDCSSFIWRILETVGIDLSTICAGSTAAEECRGMVDAGMVIPIEEIQQGDVIFYSSRVNGRYRNVTHVAFYAGDNQIVHAASTKSGVKVGNFYKSGLVCVCRPYKVQ